MMDRQGTKEVTPFPDSPRVVYRKNPLVEVICQLRFPPILRIDAEPPAPFQERIRKEYPLLRERSPDEAVEFPPMMPLALAEVARASMRMEKRQAAYDFISLDEKWRVSLTREFLALTTTSYKRWEEFREHLSRPLEALNRAYAPAFFTRIGLRYQDLIRRTELTLTEHSWPDLLEPHIAGILASTQFEGTVREALTQILIDFPERAGKVRLRHGIAQPTDANEECYLIDSDFFNDQKTEITDAIDILNYFNRQSGRLFRWCIKEKLHHAMEPVPVTE